MIPAMPLPCFRIFFDAEPAADMPSSGLAVSTEFLMKFILAHRTDKNLVALNPFKCDDCAVLGGLVVVYPDRNSIPPQHCNHPSPKLSVDYVGLVLFVRDNARPSYSSIVKPEEIVKRQPPGVRRTERQIQVHLEPPCRLMKIGRFE